MPCPPRIFSYSPKGQLAFLHPPKALISWGEFQEHGTGGSKSQLICSLGELEKERVKHGPGLGSMHVFCLRFYPYLTTPFSKERK